MRILIMLLLGIVGCISSNAQNILHDPVTGRIFSSEKYSGYKGSAFLFDEWIKGSAKTMRGTYRDLELKFDAYSNTLFFRKDDEPYEFQDKIVGFTLMRRAGDSSSYVTYRNGLTGNGIKANQFVQVLTEGKVSLYRSDLKLLSDVNQINEGVIKTFTTSTRYFLLKDDLLHPVKLGKKDLYEFMKDKESQLESYSVENKLSPKKEADLVRLVAYYNQLN